MFASVCFLPCFLHAPPSFRSLARSLLRAISSPPFPVPCRRPGGAQAARSRDRNGATSPPLPCFVSSLCLPYAHMYTPNCWPAAPPTPPIIRQRALYTMLSRARTALPRGVVAAGLDRGQPLEAQWGHRGPDGGDRGVDHGALLDVGRHNGRVVDGGHGCLLVGWGLWVLGVRNKGVRQSSIDGLGLVSVCILVGANRRSIRRGGVGIRGSRIGVGGMCVGLAHRLVDPGDNRGHLGAPASQSIEVDRDPSLVEPNQPGLAAPVPRPLATLSLCGRGRG